MIFRKYLLLLRIIRKQFGKTFQTAWDQRILLSHLPGVNQIKVSEIDLKILCHVVVIMLVVLYSPLRSDSWLESPQQLYSFSQTLGGLCINHLIWLHFLPSIENSRSGLRTTLLHVGRETLSGLHQWPKNGSLTPGYCKYMKNWGEKHTALGRHWICTFIQVMNILGICMCQQKDTAVYRGQNVTRMWQSIRKRECV